MTNYKDTINELKTKAIRRGIAKSLREEAGVLSTIENIEKEWEVVKRDNPSIFEKVVYTDDDFDVKVEDGILYQRNLEKFKLGLPEHEVVYVDSFFLEAIRDSLKD